MDNEHIPAGCRREFGASDAVTLARSLIESKAGAQFHWSAAAVETVAAIILWEARKSAAVGQ